MFSLLPFYLVILQLSLLFFLSPILTNAFYFYLILMNIWNIFILKLLSDYPNIYSSLGIISFTFAPADHLWANCISLFAFRSSAAAMIFSEGPVQPGVAESALQLSAELTSDRILRGLPISQLRFSLSLCLFPAKSGHPAACRAVWEFWFFKADASTNNRDWPLFPSQVLELQRFPQLPALSRESIQFPPVVQGLCPLLLPAFPT